MKKGHSGSSITFHLFFYEHKPRNNQNEETLPSQQAIVEGEG